MPRRADEPHDESTRIRTRRRNEERPPPRKAKGGVMVGVLAVCALLIVVIAGLAVGGYFLWRRELSRDPVDVVARAEDDLGPQEEVLVFTIRPPKKFVRQAGFGGGALWMVRQGSLSLMERPLNPKCDPEQEVALEIAQSVAAHGTKATGPEKVTVNGLSGARAWGVHHDSTGNATYLTIYAFHVDGKSYVLWGQGWGLAPEATAKLAEASINTLRKK
jgi:hypothetical protein